jgi:hypothetical protein
MARLEEPGTLQLASLACEPMQMNSAEGLDDVDSLLRFLLDADIDIILVYSRIFCLKTA